MATLTLRNVKGSSLSHDELDSNFLALDSDISTIQTDLTGKAFWDEVTGGTSIRTDSLVGIGKDPSNTLAFDVDGAAEFSGTVTANAFAGDGGSITGISVFQLSDVTSGTVVTNLNADKVDGFNGIGIYDSDGTLLNG